MISLITGTELISRYHNNITDDARSNGIHRERMAVACVAT